MPAWLIARANTLAEWRGWSPFIGLQIEYSLLERAVERELLPMARALGLGLTAWSPLGGGILSGKYASASAQPEGRSATTDLIELTERKLRIAREVSTIATQLNQSPAAGALNWLRAQPGVIPIVGARTLPQLQENLGCLEWSLPHEYCARLDEVSAFELGFPHDFIVKPSIRRFVHGETWDRVVRV